MGTAPAAAATGKGAGAWTRADLAYGRGADLLETKILSTHVGGAAAATGAAAADDGGAAAATGAGGGPSSPRPHSTLKCMPSYSDGCHNGVTPAPRKIAIAGSKLLLLLHDQRKAALQVEVRT